MVISNLEQAINFSFRKKTMSHGTAKLANTFISTFMTSFERHFSKLSENHKNFDFGSTEFKLWQLKINGGGGGVVEHLSTAIT